MSHSDTRKIPFNSSNNSPVNNGSKSEYEKLIIAITTLSNKVDTIMDNRSHDKRQIDILNDHIFNTPQQPTSPLKQQTSPLTSSTNVLNHLDDYNNTTNFNRVYKTEEQRERRQSTYNIALKISPSRASGNKNIQFLYTPISSTLQLKYVSVGTFLHFWRDFTKLQQQHPEQILQLGNFLSPHVISELVADQNGFDSNDLNNSVRGNQLNLENDVIYSMLIKKNSPRTKEIFLFELNKNLEFPYLPSGYMVTMSSYKNMYFALLEWVNKFTTLYDILTTEQIGRAHV